MTLDEYQSEIEQFYLTMPKNYESCTDPVYVAKVLGLVGEAGEVADKYKKIIRDNSGIVTAEHKAEIARELGDVLWYVATLARYIDLPLSEVADQNLAKLSARKAEGKIHGTGDHR
jgi:NTP pyrophosphatase (non-canonical NTP hydrolase)